MNRTLAPGLARAALLLLACGGGALAQDTSKNTNVAAQSADASAPREAKDPRALAVFDRMLAHLRSIPAFEVNANITQDDVVGDSFKVQRNLQAYVVVKRADRMRARLSGGDSDRVFVYNGKTLTVYAEDQKYYGTTSAPNTLLATLDAALDKNGIELPLLDVLYLALGGDLRAKTEKAGYIGIETIAGRECEQVAFRGPRADFQIWVATGEQAVPCKVVVTTRDQPTFPQYSSEMQWNEAPRLEPTTFEFAKPEGALPIVVGSGNDDEKPPTTGKKK